MAWAAEYWASHGYITKPCLGSGGACFNPSTWEAGGSLWVQGQPGPQVSFKNSQGHLQRNPVLGDRKKNILSQKVKSKNKQTNLSSLRKSYNIRDKDNLARLGTAVNLMQLTPAKLHCLSVQYLAITHQFPDCRHLESEQVWLPTGDSYLWEAEPINIPFLQRAGWLTKLLWGGPCRVTFFFLWDSVSL